MTQRARLIATLTFAISLIAAACAGSGDETAAPSSTAAEPTTTTTTAPTTTTTAPTTTTTAPTTTAAPTTTTTTVAPGDDFIEVTDDTGILSVTVPATWNDVDGTGWAIDDDQQVGVTAAPDSDAFITGWDTPGVFFGITDLEEALDDGWVLTNFTYPEDCTFGDRQPWNGSLSGTYEVWEDCGDDNATSVVLEVFPPTRDYVAVLQIIAVTDADTAGVDAVLRSFEVAPHR